MPKATNTFDMGKIKMLKINKYLETSGDIGSLLINKINAIFIFLWSKLAPIGSNIDFSL
jgi:hypothetical protein